MTEKLDAAEKNWKAGDTRSFEFLILQELRRVSAELTELRKLFDEQVGVTGPEL